MSNTVDLLKAASNRKYTEFEDLAKEMLTAKLAENKDVTNFEDSLETSNIMIGESVEDDLVGEVSTAISEFVESGEMDYINDALTEFIQDMAASELSGIKKNKKQFGDDYDTAFKNISKLTKAKITVKV